MIDKRGSEEMRFNSGGVSLAGTFVDPVGASAAALILTGSGKLDRDSNGGRFRLDVSSAIADALAARGIASLRYDKRGVGESGGDYVHAGMSENYADAVAAVGWLVTRVPGLPIFGIGHSEGALHVAHLAADEVVTGAVLIACPARRGEEILTWQAAQIAPTMPTVAKVTLKILHIDPLTSQQKAFARIRASSADSIRIQGRKQNARWLREFMDLDPRPVFERIHRPVLVVVAGQDMQVPPEDGTTICSLVPGPCEKLIVPDLSHVLREDPGSKGVMGYRKALKTPVSPVAVNAIGDWITTQLSHSRTILEEARKE